MLLGPQSPVAYTRSRQYKKSNVLYQARSCARLIHPRSLLRAMPGSDYLPASTRTDHFTQTVIMHFQKELVPLNPGLP